MATLSEYFTALQNSVTEQGHTFPLFTDDFFPYTSNWFNPKSDRFFTGFYASREVCAGSWRCVRLLVLLQQLHYEHGLCAQ